MRRFWLAGLAGAAMLATTPAATAAPTDPIVPGLEAPAGCDWRRRAKKPDAAAMLYCAGKDGKPAYARLPSGFSADTLGKARAGDPEAMNLAGLLYLDGPESIRDAAAGQDWLLKAAEAGSPYARFNLALALDSGRGGVVRNPAAAAGWYRKAVEAGDGDAMVNLGEMHLAGRGVARDDAEAMRLMRGAEGGLLARYNVAVMIFEGRGAPADKPAAITLLRKVAEDGSSAAAWRLGRVYAAGDGATADVGEAIRWTRKAGESTARLAALVLGLNYLISPDMTVKAARDGDAKAQLTLALQLLEGKRLKRDPTTAAGLLASAAKAGIPLAAYKLGELCADGDGVPKDEAMALTLLTGGVAQQFDEPWETFKAFRTPSRAAAPATKKK
mgnify:FL=1